MRFPKPTRRKRFRKPRKKRLSLKLLDSIAGRLCRSRGACEAKGEDLIACNGILQWAHIVGRGYHRVRWDEDNCLCMCSAHHFFYTYHHVHWENFLERKIGREKYEELKKRALTVGQKIDKQAIYERLRKADDATRCDPSKQEGV